MDDEIASLKRRIAALEARDCFVCHGKGSWFGNSANDEPVGYHAKCPRCGTEAPPVQFVAELSR